MMNKKEQKYTLPFALITSLFLMWGFAHSLLDVLNKHFQDALELTKAQSGIIQFSAYGAYFLMAIPAGFIARKYGYKTGIIVGLILFAIGAFCFIPAVSINSFWPFLVGLLILFAGLTCLETVANPYAIILGPPETSASRINLAQTFNAIGWILGPIVGSVLIFKNETDQSIFELFMDALHKLFATSEIKIQTLIAEPTNMSSNNSVLIAPYVALGILVVLVLILFLFIKLPEIKPEESTNKKDKLDNRPLIKQKHFILAAIAQFLYVAAQTGIGSFFINYTLEVKDLNLTELQAGLLLGMGGMGLFALGRFSGSILMKKIRPEILLGTFATINTVLMIIVTLSHDKGGVICLIASYLFMSIMFPSIFALGLKNLGSKTKTGSSILVLMIVGGAIAPILMGLLGETNMNIGFIVPLVSFLFIAYFGYFGSKTPR